jgi:hypothetical protein
MLVLRYLRWVGPRYAKFREHFLQADPGCCPIVRRRVAIRVVRRPYGAAFDSFKQRPKIIVVVRIAVLLLEVLGEVIGDKQRSDISHYGVMIKPRDRRFVWRQIVLPATKPGLDARTVPLEPIV